MKLLAVALVSSLVSCAWGCEEKSVDWSRKPLRESKEAAGDLRFSINLPDGLTAHREGDRVTWSAGQNAAGAPAISVSHEATRPPGNVGEATARALAASEHEVVYRKERINRGHVVIHHSEDRSVVVATVFRKLPDRTTLRCKARASGSKAKFEPLVAWLSNICLTLAIDKPN